ncbi:MAG TPA: class I SAM-dependent methyltransferase [Bacteroidia bacterium]|nr:class I SAM-dependent methyltransferase [Bacteroidia bacterium]
MGDTTAASPAFLDWKVETDKENIRDGAIELRAKVAENLYRKNYDNPEKARMRAQGPGFHWRINAVRKVELMTGKKLSGKIIEVGAGTGVFTAELSREKEPEVIYCLDYDKYSVEELMPVVFKNLEADFTKIQTVLGSYNRMQVTDDFFDYIISLGAIHHSENLLATFREAYRVLKPGGFLVASEHCHPNSYTQEEQRADYERPLSRERLKTLYNDDKMHVKVKDNSDHYYRICEFEAYAYAAGFNVMPYVFDIDGEKIDDQIFRRPKPYSGYSSRTFFPYFAQDTKKPVFDNLLLILHKPVPGQPAAFTQELNFRKPPEKGFFSRLFK